VRDTLRLDRDVVLEAHPPIRPATRSEANRRTRSSSSDRQNRDEPGSPWRASASRSPSAALVAPVPMMGRRRHDGIVVDLDGVRFVERLVVGRLVHLGRVEAFAGS
jgi:hypothetical protein